MSKKNTVTKTDARKTLEAAFSLFPRQDVEDKTIEYLRKFFRDNPEKETFRLTFDINRQAIKDFLRDKRQSLAYRHVKKTQRKASR